LAIESLVAELKRRRVFRVVAGYGVFAFAILQIVEPIMHGLHWPDAVLSYVVVGLGVGFPVAVILAWAFDINAGTIERTAPASGFALHGARLALVLLGLGALAAAPGLAWYLLKAKPAAPAAGPSIAVLPFSDLSEKHDQEYFADGVAEEILNALAHVQGLKVIGRTSSFSFKGKSDDLKSIGQKLEVANILQGSLRKEGDQIRLTAQLISVNDGAQRWSETYDRKLAGIFKLQDEIARTVVGSLRVKLLGEATPPAARTTTPEVYDLFLWGREQSRIVRPENNRQAVATLEKAVALDPQFAPAWAQLALAHFASVDWFGEGAKGLRAKALSEAERAVALAPELAQAYTARAHIRDLDQLDFKGALDDIDRALLTAPNDPDSLVVKAHIVLCKGTPGLVEGLGYLHRATAVDPLSVQAWTHLALSQVWSGDLAAAGSSVAKALTLAPGSTGAEYAAILLHILAGKPAAAIEVANRSEVSWVKFVGLSLAQHDLGHEKESKAALEQLIADDNEESSSAYQIAQVHARRGERQLALTALERAYRLRDTGLNNLQVDTFLKPLAAEPRFQTLAEKLRLPQ
jgi:TolB-like protein